MAHIRQQIRETIKAALDPLPTTGSRVFASRVYPLQAADLPALRVYTPEDDAEISTMGNPRRQERTIGAIVEATARGIAGVDDEIDTICAEVEKALAGNDLGGLVKDIVLDRTESELVGEGDQQIMQARMSWSCSAEVAENDPEAALP